VDFEHFGSRKKDEMSTETKSVLFRKSCNESVYWYVLKGGDAYDRCLDILLISLVLVENLKYRLKGKQK
jgi:hypothetical protein